MGFNLKARGTFRPELRMCLKMRSCRMLFPLLLAVTLAGCSSQPETNIISWFKADMDHDTKDELLVITSDNAHNALDTGQPYGDFLKLYSEFEIVNDRPIVKGEPDYTFDLSDIKPLRVQAGDINGDGGMEIAVCVYKTTKFHPVLAKRPFFYDLTADGELESVWLGSRLARPFEQYILSDVDQDGIDEIISIEWTKNGNKVAAVYDWKGFGFEVKAVSNEIEGETEFLNYKNCKENEILIGIGGEIYRLECEDDGIEFRQE